jgi:hypothetical protein
LKVESEDKEFYTEGAEGTEDTEKRGRRITQGRRVNGDSQRGGKVRRDVIK